MTIAWIVYSIAITAILGLSALALGTDYAVGASRCDGSG
jgi:hypothetical protein